MLSTFPTLLPFLLFAFVASITPGPTNILVLSHSARYGFRAALPIVFGACVSASLIVLLMGTGLGQALSQHSNIQLGMRLAGVLWLSYLAWQLSKAPMDVVDPRTPHQQLGILGGATLQWVNPKTWMMAITVASVFAGNEINRQQQILLLAGVFLCISLPCLATWAFMGSRARGLLGSLKNQHKFNQAMALLLLLSSGLSFY